MRANPGARRSRTTRGLVALASGLVVWSVLAVAAHATSPGNTYAATATLVTAGTSPSVTISLTNNVPNQQIGSLQITAPAGIAITATPTPSVGTASWSSGSSSFLVQGMALQPTQKVTIAVPSNVECDATPASGTGYSWAIIAKQANDFNGLPGNTVNGNNPTSAIAGGPCSLTILHQPTSAQSNVAGFAAATITDVVYGSVLSPSAPGNPITVRVLDGGGTTPVAWTWNGSVSLTLNAPPKPTGGALTGGASPARTNNDFAFTASVDKSGTGYTVTASMTGGGAFEAGTTASGASNAFNIVDSVGTCAANAKCNPTIASGPRTKASVTANTGASAGDYVILSVADPAIDFSCSGTAQSDAISFNVLTATGGNNTDRTKLAEIRLLAAYVTKPASKYVVCWSAANPFLTRSGGTSPSVGGSYVGILPICNNKNPYSTAPCEIGATIDKVTGDLVMQVAAPAGDPGGRIY